MSITRRFLALLGAAAASTLVSAAPAAGQATITPARNCDRVDTTASWYRRQAEWWALEAKHDWTDDSSRTRLLSVAELIAPPTHERFPIQNGAAADQMISGKLPIDLLRKQLPAARQLLRDMAQRRAWPLRSNVGPAGVRAAWLIVIGDSALTNTAMHRMMEAGPGEVSETDVAMLEDWLRLKTGRKQLYGTRVRFVTEGGKETVVPEPIEDLAHVDLRRDAAGLPPLAFALCYAARQPHI